MSAARVDAVIATVERGDAVLANWMRPRLWARWAAFNQGEDLDAFAARRSRETAVVILSPRPHARSRGNRSVRSAV